MTKARDEFAAKLSGREYGSEMTKAEEAEAEAARLLVIFGASDDLTEFLGIIHDEAGAYDDAEHFILQSKGQWSIFDGDPEEAKGALISAFWCPEDPKGASWLIKPSVPHATFDIIEDGELFCRGAVIDEEDLLPAQRVLLVDRSLNHPYDLVMSFSEPPTHADIASIHEHLKEWSR